MTISKTPTHLAHLVHWSVVSVQHASLDQPITQVKHLQQQQQQQCCM
jgi:hypothetical protein